MFSSGCPHRPRLGSSACRKRKPSSPGKLDTAVVAELTPHQAEQRRAEGLVSAVQGRDGPRPEILANDGGSLKKTSRSEESRRSRRAARSAWIVRRQLHELGPRPAQVIGEHRDELLGVQRFPCATWATRLRRNQSRAAADRLFASFECT